MSAYNPLAFLVSGWTHRRLVARLAWRKIESRYRGSLLGLLWALIQPLLMLCIYTFVFKSPIDDDTSEPIYLDLAVEIFVFEDAMDLGEFTLETPHVVSGHVIDEDGEGLEGMVLEFFDESGTEVQMNNDNTDADGPDARSRAGEHAESNWGGPPYCRRRRVWCAG